MKTEESYFGVNNEPILDRNGFYHKRITQYDAKGKIVNFIVYDLKNKIIKKVKISKDI